MCTSSQNLHHDYSECINRLSCCWPRALVDQQLHPNGCQDQKYPQRGGFDRRRALVIACIWSFERLECAHLTPIVPMRMGTSNFI